MNALLLLPALEDERATLEAALAFLDGFESDACATDGSQSPDIDSCSAIRSRSSDDRGDDSALLRRHREHAHRASPLAKPARRYRKAEILQLRKQAGQLTAQLSGLQARCARERRALEPRETAEWRADNADATTVTAQRRVSAKGTADDLRAAMLEHRRLQEAKALNLRLKVEWRQQLELMRVLEATFEQQFVDLNFGAMKEATYQPSLSALEDSPTIARDLSKQFTEVDAFVEAMYFQAATVIAYINLQDTSRAFSCARVYPGHPSGQMLEFVSSTPLACSLEQLETHMWSFAAHKNRHRPPTQEDKALAASHQHNYTQSLDCKFGTIHLEGESIVRKFTEANRTIHVVVSRLGLEETDLRFRETAWMVMEERRSASGSPVVVLQMCYRTHPELLRSRDSSAASAETTAYFQDFILHARSDSLRAKQLMLHSTLLERFGGATPMRGAGEQDDDGAALEAALALLDSDTSNNSSSSGSSSALSLDALPPDDYVDSELCLEELFASPSATPCALTTSTSISSTTTASSDSNAGSPVTKEQQQKTASATRRRAGASTALVPRVRKRSKAEILMLREQILQLTARLEQLQLAAHTRQSEVGASSTMANRLTVKRLPLLDVKGCVVVLEDAATELRKLQAAEALNVQLKVEWRKQTKLAAKLDAAFKRHIMQLDFDELLDPKITRPPSALRTVQSSTRREPVAFVNLVEYLEALYHDTASLAASFHQSNTSRVFTDSRIYHDERLGQTLEFVMNAPLAGRAKEIDDYLWSVLAHDKDVDHAEIMNEKKRGKTRVWENHFSYELECQFGTIRVDGVSGARKYTDAHRRLIVFASTMVLAGSDLQFREEAWLLFGEQHMQSGPASPVALLQTCYRIRSETPSASSATFSPSTASYFQEFVVQAQCEKMRADQLRILETMLGRFGSPAPLLLAPPVRVQVG